MCVPKKDQTFGFCVHYSGLNSQTTFDTQRMPKNDDIINRLSRAKLLTKIDLTKGYCLIALSDQVKPISALGTPFGQYQLRVMPFGVMPFASINSRASFVRLIKKVLSGLEDFTDSFVDEILTLVLHGQTILVI